MKRVCLLLGLILFLSIDCFSQMLPRYFSRRSNKKYEYVVKGVIIDKKAIAYLSYEGEIKDSIVALNIQVIDSYNYDIEDTVWVYTDFANYFSRKRKIDTSNRDSVWFLQFEDVNWESCITHINFDRFDRVYNNFAIGKPGYFRFWKENGYYVYGFEDNYVSLIIHDDRLFVERNRWDKFIDRLLPLDRFYFVSAKQFERTLKRRKR